MGLDAIKANQERASLAKPQHAGSKWVTRYRDDVASLLIALEVSAAMYERSEARVARLEQAIRGCLTTRDGWPLCRVCGMTRPPDQPLLHMPECWAVHLLAVAEAPS